MKGLLHYPFLFFQKVLVPILMQNIGNFCILRLAIHNEFIWRLLCCNYLLFFTLETNFECILCRTYHKLLYHIKLMQKTLEGQKIYMEFTPAILQYLKDILFEILIIIAISIDQFESVCRLQ